MKFVRSTLVVILFAVLLATEMQGLDPDEDRHPRRNDRRKSKKTRQRRFRNRNNHKRRDADFARTTSEDLTTTTAPGPLALEASRGLPPQQPEIISREAAMVKQHQAVQDLLSGPVNPEHRSDAGATTTTEANAMDSGSFDTNGAGNMTWSGDHDLMSINATWRHSARNTTALNETLGNGTATTPKQPRTTPNPNRLAIWRIQQRNKHMRLMMIQRQILQRLGFQKQPNVSTTLTTEDRRTWAEIYDQIRTGRNSHGREYEEDYDAKLFFWHLPSCETPRRSDNTWSSDGPEFRLYFDVKGPRQLNKETRVASSTLSLYKKAYSGCECELRSKNPTTQPPPDQERRRRHSSADQHPSTEHEGLENEKKEDDDDSDNSDAILVTLYQYQRPVKKKRREKRVAIETIEVTKRQEGWIKFSLGHVVTQWLRNPGKNFGLVIAAKDKQFRELNADLLFESYNCSGNHNQSQFHIPVPLALPGSSVTERNRTSQHLHANQSYPYLEVVTKDVALNSNSHRQRFKRDTQSKGCVRQDMHVSFDGLGWSDWIIQPRSFEAGFCKGTCSTVTADDLTPPLLVNHVTSTKPDGTKLCCGPTKLKDLQIVHQDEHGKMVVSILEDFIIAECGCQP